MHECAVGGCSAAARSPLHETRRSSSAEARTAPDATLSGHVAWLAQLAEPQSTCDVWNGMSYGYAARKSPTSIL